MFTRLFRNKYYIIKKINIRFLPSEIEPTTCRVYSHACVSASHQAAIINKQDRYISKVHILKPNKIEIQTNIYQMNSHFANSVYKLQCVDKSATLLHCCCRGPYLLGNRIWYYLLIAYRS